MKKRPPLLEELVLWIRGRFTLTDEEKLWLLLFLVICWVGLLGRYFYLRTQTPEPLTTPQVEQLLAPQAK